PGNPIMPGVKMVEALAQAGALAVLSEEENRGKLALFAGLEDVRFKRIVRPGEELTLTCDLETVRGPIGRGKARATADGELAGLDPKQIDLIVVATVTPDMAVPSTGAILGDLLGSPDADCYDLSAGCTGFMYALAQAYGMIAGGLANRALVVGGDVLSKILDW